MPHCGIGWLRRLDIVKTLDGVAIVFPIAAVPGVIHGLLLLRVPVACMPCLHYLLFIIVIVYLVVVCYCRIPLIPLLFFFFFVVLAIQLL